MCCKQINVYHSYRWACGWSFVAPLHPQDAGEVVWKYGLLKKGQGSTRKVVISFHFFHFHGCVFFRFSSTEMQFYGSFAQCPLGHRMSSAFNGSWYHMVSPSRMQLHQLQLLHCSIVYFSQVLHTSPHQCFYSFIPIPSPQKPSATSVQSKIRKVLPLQ